MTKRRIHIFSLGLGIVVAALGTVLMNSKAIAHCCHAHPVAPYDSHCCHPSTTVYVAPAYGYGAASVRGVSRRTSRRTSRRVSRRR